MSLDCYKADCQKEVAWVKAYHFFASLKLTEEEKNVKSALNWIHQEVKYLFQSKNF